MKNNSNIAYFNKQHGSTMASQTRKKPTFDGHEIANTLYGDRPRKRRKKIEKVKKPSHWKKDFQPKHLEQ